jgi:hypothetical protein
VIWLGRTRNVTGQTTARDFMMEEKIDVTELRRIFLEREGKKRELDDLDRALRKALGIETGIADRKKSLSESDFIALCGGRHRERISKAK